MIYYITTQYYINNDTFKGKSYEVLNSIEPLIEYLKSESIIGVDTETEGFCPFTKKLLLAQFGNKEVQYVLNCKEFDVKGLKPYLEDKSKLFIFQNAKFDLRFFMVQGINITNVYDTYLAESLLLSGKDDPEKEEESEVTGKKTSGQRSLEKITLKYCNYQLSKDERGKIHRGITTSVIVYSAEDV